MANFMGGVVIMAAIFAVFAYLTPPFDLANASPDEQRRFLMTHGNALANHKKVRRSFTAQVPPVSPSPNSKSVFMSVSLPTGSDGSTARERREDACTAYLGSELAKHSITIRLSYSAAGRPLDRLKLTHGACARFTRKQAS